MYPEFEGAIRDISELRVGEEYCKYYDGGSSGPHIFKLRSIDYKYKTAMGVVLTPRMLIYRQPTICKSGLFSHEFAGDVGVSAYDGVHWNSSNYLTHKPIPDGRGRKARMRGR